MSQVPTARSWTLRHGEVIYSHIFTTTARKYKTTRIFQQQPQAWFIYRFPGKGQWETIHSMVSQPAAPGKGLDPPRHMLILLLLFMLSISSWGGLVRHPLVMFFFMKCSSISWLVFTLPYYYFHLFIFILVFVCYLFVIVFPGGSGVSSAGDLGSIPGSGRSPGEGNGNLLQYSCLGNPTDGEAWWAAVHEVTRDWIWLSN